MVNADRVKRKLPSLLVESSTTKRKNWNSLMHYRYRLEQFKKRNSEKFNILVNRVIFVLSELEKAVSLNIERKKEAHQGPKVKNEKVSNRDIET